MLERGEKVGAMLPRGPFRLFRVEVFLRDLRKRLVTRVRCGLLCTFGAARFERVDSVSE